MNKDKLYKTKTKTIKQQQQDNNTIEFRNNNNPMN